jgi:hypothetical protein
MGICRSVLAIAALLIPGILSAETAAPEWAGIWRGTIGDLPVQACLQSRDFGNVGAYYYLKHLKIITLGPVDSAGQSATEIEWSEAPYSDKAKDGPLWKNVAVMGNVLSGIWTGGGSNLPIAMTRLTQIDPEEQPCGDLAFSKPRITKAGITAQRKTLDGKPFDALTLNVGKHFEDVSLESFQLPGTSAAVRHINSILKEEIAAKPEDSEYLGCSMSNLGSHGSDGEYSRGIKPVVLTQHWMVSELTMGDYCGGAHPNWGQSWTTWDLRTGKEIDLWTWLSPLGAKITPQSGYTRIELTPKLKAMLTKSWPRKDADCADVPEYSDYWDVKFTKSGFAFTPNLPHVALACSEDVAFSFAQIAPMLNKAGKAGIASFRADLAKK